MMDKQRVISVDQTFASPPSQPPPIARLYGRQIFLCLLLAAVTLCIYWQSGSHDFVNFDDNVYVTENMGVKKGVTWSSITWAFSTFHASNWHPVTWLSHMADIELYGLEAKGHHLTNALLHTVNALLLFLLLTRATGARSRSFFIAALFALHPLNVESVAWIAERKNLLSTLFGFLAIHAYLRYAVNRDKRYYFALIACFALSLMAKSMLVTLPFLLLLLDHWPLQRLVGRNTLAVVLEKIPLLLLSMASSIITYKAQELGDAVVYLQDNPLSTSIPNALVSCVTYLKKFLLPSDLAVFYPHPLDTIPAWETVLAGSILFGITLLVTKHRKTAPYAVTGWFWYIGSLVPVIGIVRVGSHAYADRYTYVPLIGIFLVVVWGISDCMARRKPGQTLHIAACSLVFPLLATLTWIQLGYWRDSATLFERAIAVTDRNWLAHNNLGIALLGKGRIGEATRQMAKALAIRDRYETALFNMGRIMEQTGQEEAALWYFDRSISCDPGYLPSYLALVELQMKRGDSHGAVETADKAALRNGSCGADVHNSLGAAFAGKGKMDEAIRHYTLALQYNRNLPDAWYNLGHALAKQGNNDEAIAHFNEALRLNPDDADTHNNLGVVLAIKGDLRKAIAHYNEALRIRQDFEQVRSNLGRAMKDYQKVSLL